MKELTVDFTGVKYYSQFYEVIKRGLEFPDWCGDNLDAVLDLLRGYWCGIKKVDSLFSRIS